MFLGLFLYLKLAAQTLIWLAASIVLVSVYLRSKNNRIIWFAVAALVVASFPAWHLGLRSWIEQREQAEKIAAANESDALASRQLQSVCKAADKVELFAKRTQQEISSIRVTETHDNGNFSLWSDITIYIPDRRPCVGQICTEALLPRRTKEKGSDVDDFLLSIGKATILEGGRIGVYMLTLSTSQGEKLAATKVFRLRHPNTFAGGKDVYCPELRTQLKMLLETVFGRSFP